LRLHWGMDRDVFRKVVLRQQNSSADPLMGQKAALFEIPGRLVPLPRPSALEECTAIHNTPDKLCSIFLLKAVLRL
jgi:hypothetical protein